LSIQDRMGVGELTGNAKPTPHNVIG